MTESTITQNMMDPKRGLLFFMLWLQVLLGIMFLCIYMGVPMFLSILIMIGLIYVLIRHSIFRTTVTINSEFICAEYKPYSRKSFVREKKFTYKWSDILWYKWDKDWVRYSGEMEFLKIKFRDNNVIKITNDTKSEIVGSFEEFRNAFLKLAEYDEEMDDKSKFSIPTSSEENHEEKIVEIPRKTPPIIRKPGFYSTTFAKVLSIFFAIVVIGLGYMLMTMSHSSTSWFKYFAVIIPGVGYMLYRTFFGKS